MNTVSHLRTNRRRERGSRMLTFINESTDPFYNQAFEEFVFENYAEDDVFYLWQNRPAIVVGCYQNICREVNVHALRRRGVPVVRRMTGGGTVYHDLGNVNYSFMLRADGALDYDHFLDPVIVALNRMGIPPTKTGAATSPSGTGRSPAAPRRLRAGGFCTTARCCSRATLHPWMRSRPMPRTTRFRPRARCRPSAR